MDFLLRRSQSGRQAVIKFISLMNANRHSSYYLLEVGLEFFELLFFVYTETNILIYINIKIGEAIIILASPFLINDCKNTY